MLVSDAKNTVIHLPIWTWRAVIFDLRRRSAGRRESGAFLLGHERTTAARITTYVCYDDLDPDAYQGGAISFHACGYAKLWQHCKDKKLKVLVDAHTHPGPYVEQSSIDQRHPMLPIVGHTAMIVPNFGKTSWWSLNTIGVYEYLGDFKWRTHAALQKPRRIKLSFW
jgi:proteasome lid subunit RPN8/RPN11